MTWCFSINTSETLESNGFDERKKDSEKTFCRTSKVQKQSDTKTGLKNLKNTTTKGMCLWNIFALFCTFRPGKTQNVIKEIQKKKFDFPDVNGCR